MTASLATLALQALSALAIALISAIVTVRLSQRRFRAERLWDRKVLAYERVIEAFHQSKKFSSEHLDAEYMNREVAADREKKLRLLADAAHEEIIRTADIGSFTLSEHSLKLLSDYQRESGDDEDIHTFQDHLEHDLAVTNKYMKLFIAEAKRDLER